MAGPLTLEGSGGASLSCDIHIHTPAPKSYTNFLLCPFVLHIIFCELSRV